MSTGFLSGLVVKNLPPMQETWAGDECSISELGRFPWRRKWQQLQYSCLGNPNPWGQKRVGHNWATKQEERCPHPNSWNLWLCYVTWLKKKKEKHFADAIKLRILSKSGYPGSSRWAQCSHKGPHEGKSKVGESESEVCRCSAVAMNMEEGATEPGNAGSLWELEKTWKHILL